MHRWHAAVSPRDARTHVQPRREGSWPEQTACLTTGAFYLMCPRLEQESRHTVNTVVILWGRGLAWETNPGYHNYIFIFEENEMFNTFNFLRMKNFLPISLIVQIIIVNWETGKMGEVC